MFHAKTSWLLAARLSRVRNIHKAVYSFRQPRRKSDLIPKCPQVWRQYLINLVKSRVHTRIKHLNTRELEHVLSKTRVEIAEKFSPSPWTLDLPPCYVWDDKQIGEWLISIGFPQLKECFQQNNITGRKLIIINPKFLNQIGLRHIDEITTVHQKIRLLLGLRPTSSILLQDNLGLSLYEEYLWKRSYSGKTYDALTFRSYCIQRGFPQVEYFTLPSG